MLHSLCYNVEFHSQFVWIGILLDSEGFKELQRLQPNWLEVRHLNTMLKPSAEYLL